MARLLIIFPLLFSLLYIGMELSFNLTLIDFLNSKNTEISDFENLETFGRVLSSIGLAIALLGIFFRKVIKSKGIFCMAAVTVAVAIYMLQTAIFEKIVENLPPEQKVTAYSMGVYRNLNLNDQVDLKIFNGQDPSYDSVVNSMFAALLSNETLSESVKASVTQFFKAENTIDQASLIDAYQQIHKNLPNLDAYWGVYAIESKKYENFPNIGKQIYRQRFVNTLGIEPSLSRMEFNAEMNKRFTNKAEIDSIVIVPAFENFNIPALTLGQIPSGLGEQAWVAYVNQHIDSAIAKTELSTVNVEGLPHSKNIINSVVITPIAVALSLIALISNICLLIGRKSKVHAGVVLGIAVTVGLTWGYNPYGMHPALNHLAGLQTQFVKVLAPYQAMLHDMFIDDSHGETHNVVRIDKPTIPDMSDSKAELDKKFSEMSSGSMDSQTQSLDDASKSIAVDHERLKDKGYFGMSNTVNPYAK